MNESIAPDYGIDAPGVVRNFFILGGVMFVGGWFIPTFRFLGIDFSFVGSIFIWWGAAWLVTSTLMVLYAKKGKFLHRDRMLDMVHWKGTETVLDIGTGRGLLMIGAAKRLTAGKSIGIDIWNAEDLSDNKMENTLKNATAEGVQGKIEIKSEDVRKMSFSDNTFDVILSNLCVHNLYKPEEREAACKEIARVLKPGGLALISDFRHTKQYAESFKTCGLKVSICGPYWKDTFPKLTIVEVRKEQVR
jgi:SAM-dependent methyltransferase